MDKLKELAEYVIDIAWAAVHDHNITTSQAIERVEKRIKEYIGNETEQRNKEIEILKKHIKETRQWNNG